ncbi:MAG: hypothetical protein RMK67_02775 [Chloroflexota bacterium]|nr:hypothetical protein [Chloroflexota bacterium]
MGGAYEAREIWRHLRRRAVRSSIPQDPRRRRRPRLGRPYCLAWPGYRVGRGAAERFFAWLEGWFRRLALRYERRLATFAAFVHLACFLIVWRAPR